MKTPQAGFDIRASHSFVICHWEFVILLSIQMSPDQGMNGLSTDQPGLETDLGPAECDRNGTIFLGLLGGLLELNVVDSGNLRFRFEFNGGNPKRPSGLFQLHFRNRADFFRRKAGFFQD